MKEVHLYQRLSLSTDWQNILQLPFYWISLAKENSKNFYYYKVFYDLIQ